MKVTEVAPSGWSHLSLCGDGLNCTAGWALRLHWGGWGWGWGCLPPLASSCLQHLSAHPRAEARGLEGLVPGRWALLPTSFCSVNSLRRKGFQNTS